MDKLQEKSGKLLYEKRGGLNKGKYVFSWYRWTFPLSKIQVFQNKLIVSCAGGKLWGWKIELRKKEIEKIENYSFLWARGGLRIFYRKKNETGCIIFWPDPLALSGQSKDNKLISVLKKAYYPFKD